MEKISIKDTKFANTGRVVYMNEEDLMNYAKERDFEGITLDGAKDLYETDNEIRVIFLGEKENYKVKSADGKEYLVETTNQFLRGVLKEKGITEWEMITE